MKDFLPTPLDDLLYASIRVGEEVYYGLDRLYGTEAAELDTSEFAEPLNDIADVPTLVNSLVYRHVDSGDPRTWRYSDGRKVTSGIEIETGHTFSHVWHPNPILDKDLNIRTETSTGTRTIRVRVDGQVIDVVDGELEPTPLQQMRELHDLAPATAQSIEQIEQLEKHVAATRGTGVHEQVGPLQLVSEQFNEQARAAREAVEKSRDDQTERLFEARTKLIVARDESLQQEPWSMFCKEIQGYTADGAPASTLSIPSITAKETFGLRLALELASEAGDESDVQDTVNEYFSMIREPDQMMLVAMSALTNLATFVMPQMYKAIEGKIGDYDMRVAFADTALMTWEKRLADFGGASAGDGIDSV